MLASGFASGWVAKRHVTPKQRSAVSSEKINLRDASQSVRSEVLKQPKSFQAGYTKRDPGQVNQFINELFPRDKNIVLLSSDSPTNEAPGMNPFHNSSMAIGKTGATSA